MSDRAAPPFGRLACLVVGRVQGVGFRWFVRERARRLGLAGTVENREDGTVEVHAAGPVTALASLRSLLLEGPPGSVVDRIDEQLPALTALPEPFQILR